MIEDEKMQKEIKNNKNSINEMNSSKANAKLYSNGFLISCI